MKTLIGCVLIILFGALVLNSFGQQVSGYENFEDATRSSHIIGEWLESLPHGYDSTTNTFSFWMRDSIGDVKEVLYFNPQPANFEDAERVVVYGEMNEDIFIAENILMKCPSKYNDTI